MANKMYKVVAEELKKEEEDMVKPDVELSDLEIFCQQGYTPVRTV